MRALALFFSLSIVVIVFSYRLVLYLRCSIYAYVYVYVYVYDTGRIVDGCHVCVYLPVLYRTVPYRRYCAMLFCTDRILVAGVWPRFPNMR